MKTLSLLFKTIFVLLFSTILINCTGTDLDEETGIQESEQQAGDEDADKGIIQHPNDRDD